ncbi:hypothetical protein MSPP1_003752 [Malassezia sp. CBS 17886]|nr:hypothetical protein MSPP1_003752 [Malassezia sp. CBS 17886]
MALLAHPAAARADVAALWASLVAEAACRGPDCAEESVWEVAGGAVRVFAAVLCLRGAEVTAQPFVDAVSHGLVFLWNGQMFASRTDMPWGGADAPAHGDAARCQWSPACPPPAENDGAALFRHLVRATTDAHARGEADPVECALHATVSCVQGPYAFLLLDRNERVLYGRDALGRRSLLTLRWRDTFALASAGSCASAQRPDVVHAEVPCDALWCVQLVAALCDSVRQRVTGIRTAAPVQSAHSAHAAVLFSGGLDCTVVARLAHEYVPPSQPIDLVTVAFENPRAIRAARAAGGDAGPGDFPHDPYAVPDRITARLSHAELQQCTPARRWNLVEVNVPYAQYCAERARIEALLCPSASVMDLSIGAALFFAARAHGVCDGRTYRSPARVLLSGLGADELLGGYARHRHAWERGGDAALAAELKLDMERLPTRNLGRDDRVVSAHGREVRYPYLAEDVVALLCALPVTAKTNFGAGHRLPPDKHLLRTRADALGLHSAARLPKRAIQFGARSAKMEDARKGHEGAWKGG